MRKYHIIAPTAVEARNYLRSIGVDPGSYFIMTTVREISNGMRGTTGETVMVLNGALSQEAEFLIKSRQAIIDYRYW